MPKVTTLKFIQYLFLLCLIYFTYKILGGGVILILDSADLIFHEAGHTIFTPLGETAHFLGGTLGQLFFPLIFFFYFLFKQKRYSALIMSWWLGENLIDIAIYMKDARVLLLPLLGGEASIHDWMFLFMKYDLLQYDIIIGSVVWYLGAFFMIASIIAAGYFSYRSE